MKSLVGSNRQTNERDATMSDQRERSKYFIKLVTIDSVPSTPTHEQSSTHTREASLRLRCYSVRPHAIIHKPTDSSDTCVFCNRMCKSHLTIRSSERLGRTQRTRAPHTHNQRQQKETKSDWFSKHLSIAANVSLAKVRCWRCHTKLNCILFTKKAHNQHSPSYSRKIKAN